VSSMKKHVKKKETTYGAKVSHFAL